MYPNSCSADVICCDVCCDGDRLVTSLHSSDTISGSRVRSVRTLHSSRGNIVIVSTSSSDMIIFTHTTPPSLFPQCTVSPRPPLSPPVPSMPQSEVVIPVLTNLHTARHSAEATQRRAPDTQCQVSLKCKLHVFLHSYTVSVPLAAVRWRGDRFA